MKVAIAHEFLTQFGGAERVLLALNEIYPDAPIYVLVRKDFKQDNYFKNLNIHTSSLQKWFNLLGKRQKLLLSFYPYAIEQFNFSEFDLVISSSNSFAKGIITSPDTIHICYCHSPTRYLWDYKDEYLKEQGMSVFSKVVVNKMLDNLRIWDYQAAQRVDYFIANSMNVKKRIKKYYRHDSEVIYPPVGIKKFNLNNKRQGDYFLLAGRLSAYKKTELALEAFSQLKDKLVIIGEGADFYKFKNRKLKNVNFVGFVDDKKLEGYYQNCCALIFPQEEDFGIIPVEAMATGTPVIAYKKGGTIETVIDGETGIFFEKQSKGEIMDAIERFKKIKHKFNPTLIRKHAEKFDERIFKEKVKKFIFNIMKDEKT